MRTHLLLTSLALLPLLTWAQAPVDSCHCSQVFNQVYQKVADNYSGWFDKVSDKTQSRHTQLLDSLRQVAGRTTTDAGCLSVLKRYKAFFRDGHFQVSLRNAASTTSTSVRQIALTEAQAKTQLLNTGKQHYPIEGIWETPDHAYKIAIVPDPQRIDSLVGIVLTATNPQWKPGTVKLELTATQKTTNKGHYRNAAFEDVSVQITQTGNLVEVSDYGTWVRLFPQAVTTAERQTYMEKQSPIAFRQINPQVAYLRISSFNVSRDVVDSLVKANRSVLRQTPTLIIDIRDNSGGSNSSFASLLPLMNTNNFQDIYGYMRTSPDNIASEEALVAQARASHWDVDSVLNTWAAEIASAKQHPNQLYRSEGALIRIDSVLPYPAHVAVLMNDKCYSSAEYFAYYAKQSRKTTLFGQHTGGVMDYGNVRAQKLDCPRFVLRLPTTRTGWVDTAPIDNVGFQPDVPIPASETDWIDYVVRYYSPSVQPPGKRSRRNE